MRVNYRWDAAAWRRVEGDVEAGIGEAEWAGWRVGDSRAAGVRCDNMGTQWEGAMEGEQERSARAGSGGTGAAQRERGMRVG